VEEAKEVEANFCRCPFCSCVFCTKADLDRHLAAFGNDKEEHADAYRRTHGRLEYGSASGPEWET
jgi:uncharacterized C2H2 Zn-finger protein